MPDTIEQRSAEWYRQRLGNATASRMYDIIDTTRTGYTAKRSSYMIELLAERLTGITQEHYVNEAMLWGIDNEDFARAAYEARNGVPVIETGYVQHPSIDHSGGSPDGLVSYGGLIEIKCPTTKTHIQFALDGLIDPKYQAQMAWYIECTGREWCDFVSYDPRLPENVRLIVKRYVPEPAYLEYLRVEVKKFLAELAELEAKIRAYKA